MILQALKEYYDRKASDPDSGIAPEGWEKKGIPFLLVIDQTGNFVGFQDTREAFGKKKRPKEYLVPSLGEKKGNGIKANLLWENIEYMLGIPVATEKKSNPDVARVEKQHAAFVEKVNDLPGDPSAIIALRSFLGNTDLPKVAADPIWPEVLKLNQVMLFAIAGQGPITDIPEVRKSIDAQRNSSQQEHGRRCLVTGVEDVIAILEPPIRGLRGANPTGASLVSFQKSSGYDSFGKEQGANAPIGKAASFAYVTALNTLLNSATQKLQVGDAATVFWSARETSFESAMASFFADPPKDDPDRLTEAVKSLMRSADTGALSLEGDTRFYVLGLSPNAARISVRFWQVGTVAEMAGRFRQHFTDLMIAHGPKERDHLPLWRVLAATAAQGKSDNLPPKLAGDTMRTILAGLPYPQTLLQATIRRIHAEHEVTYPRAALIKACINRTTRFNNPDHPEELKMSLDEGNQNVGYRLGRLFTALERIQERASPGINATIRDRYYGAASGTPATVFGTLIRLSKHHLAKLENAGERVNLERLLGEIMSGIADFPAHLPLADQGRFAIGYYHQRQKFFEKKSSEKAE